jgi:hypothetical protein
MATRENLRHWVEQALRALGGEGTIVEVARHMWENHEDELRASGDLFYTWQYDMRWAAQRLRDGGALAPLKGSRRGIWALKR